MLDVVRSIAVTAAVIMVLVAASGCSAAPSRPAITHATGQSKSAACTVLREQVPGVAQGIERGVDLLATDPAGAVEAVRRVSVSFDAAVSTITDTAVRRSARASSQDLRALTTELSAYVATPANGSARLVAAAQRVDDGFSAIARACA